MIPIPTEYPAAEVKAGMYIIHEGKIILIEDRQVTDTCVRYNRYDVHLIPNSSVLVVGDQDNMNVIEWLAMKGNQTQLLVPQPEPLLPWLIDEPKRLEVSNG